MAQRLPVQVGLNLLVAFCNLTVAFSFGLFSLPIFYPVLVRTHGWNHASVAAGGSIVLVIIGTVSPLIGWLVDRFNAKAVLLVGIFVVSASLLLLSSAGDLEKYLLFCAVLGVGTSAVSIVPNSMLIASFFSRARGVAVGIINAGIGAGGFIAPILASHEISRRGIAGTCLFLALCMTIPFLLTLFVARTESVGAGGPAAASTMRAPVAKKFVRMPMFWIFGVSLFLGAHATIAVQQHLVLYLVGQGFTAHRSALALSTALGASFAGKLFSGAVADKYSARLAMLLTILFAGLGIAALESSATQSSQVYLSAFVFGLGYGGIFNAAPLIVFEYFGTHRVGTALGLLIVFFGLGSASGGILAGYIFDRTHGYSVPFSVDLVFACIALIVLLVGGRQTRSARVPLAV